MPLFPQGGGLYPDSIDNSLLADMPEATIKGRVAGSGTGNPVDLTGAQLSAILSVAAGAATYGNCRLDYVSTSVVRLNRRNGCLLTIDNVPQVIPAAGVNLAPTGLTVSDCYYVYAYMNAGVMALEASKTVMTLDARNGLNVKTGDATRTLVGAVYINTGPLFISSSVHRGVCSFFNRYRSQLSLALSLTTSSTTIAPLGGILYTLSPFGDDTVWIAYNGHGSGNTGATVLAARLRVRAIGVGGVYGSYSDLTPDVRSWTVNNGWDQNLSCSSHHAVPSGLFLQEYALHGWVNAGIGTWTGQTQIAFNY